MVSSWCKGQISEPVISEFEPRVALLYSLSDKYVWERYKPPYSSSYGLGSTITVLQEGGWI